MPYNDEHLGNSKAAYDGKLIDLADARARYRRDKELQTKYEEAEAALDSEQFTWSDVEANL